MSLARRMGVSISRVYVVPAGKGHLTNAYGMSNAIALTDNLGKHLTKSQIEYVIAHELAHVKLRHGRQHLFLVLATYSVMALLLFVFRKPIAHVWPPVQLLVVVGPLLLFYYVSRCSEFAADREAVAFTNDPETAIRGLLALQQSRKFTNRN